MEALLWGHPGYTVGFQKVGFRYDDNDFHEILNHFKSFYI